MFYNVKYLYVGINDLGQKDKGESRPLVYR